MSSANQPVELPPTRPLEALSYESVGQGIDPRWLIRMIALVVLVRALWGLTSSILTAINNFSSGALDARFLLSQMRLPETILLVLAAVLLLLRRRAALGVVIAAYGVQILTTIVSSSLSFYTTAAAAKAFPKAFAGRHLPSLWEQGASLVVYVAIGTLEALAIILIVARCRKAGALD